MGVDGGVAVPNDPNQVGNNSGWRWSRAGDTFETLTLVPSIDASVAEGPDRKILEYSKLRQSCVDGGCVHWHGFVERGELL